jgi:hypothetical protein
MTQQEHTERAKAYVDQALARANGVDAAGGVPEGAAGDWASLRANLKSAAADLAEATKPAQPTA